MARPRKEELERRVASTRADLTVAEKEHVREQASLAGLSEADFVRRRITGLPVQPPPQRADAALVVELNRIGVNLNQLARAENAGREYRGDWKALEAEHRRVLEKVAAVFEDAGLLAQLNRLGEDLKLLAMQPAERYGGEFRDSWREIEAELKRALKRAGRQYDS